MAAECHGSSGRGYRKKRKERILQCGLGLQNGTMYDMNASFDSPLLEVNIRIGLFDKRLSCASKTHLPCAEFEKSEYGAANGRASFRVTSQRTRKWSRAIAWAGPQKRNANSAMRSFLDSPSKYHNAPDYVFRRHEGGVNNFKCPQERFMRKLELKYWKQSHCVACPSRWEKKKNYGVLVSWRTCSSKARI